MAQELSQCFTLAILSRSERGAAAVLNLLRLAGMASYFEAIWTMPLRSVSVVSAVWRSKAVDLWRSFEPPMLPDAKPEPRALTWPSERLCFMAVG